MAASALSGTHALSQTSSGTASKPNAAPVRYCLNMSTINSSKIPLREQIQIAAKAGYTGVELWLRDVDRFIDEKGDLAALRRELTTWD